MLPTATTFVLLNPVPERFNVNAAEPAAECVGLIALRAGVGVAAVVVVVVLAAGGVLLEHPVRKPTRMRVRERAKRRNEARPKRDDTERGTGTGFLFTIQDEGCDHDIGE